MFVRYVLNNSYPPLNRCKVTKKTHSLQIFSNKNNLNLAKINKGNYPIYLSYR